MDWIDLDEMGWDEVRWDTSLSILCVCCSCRAVVLQYSYVEEGTRERRRGGEQNVFTMYKQTG
jgi:hypothetical protein